MTSQAIQLTARLTTHWERLSERRDDDDVKPKESKGRERFCEGLASSLCMDATRMISGKTERNQWNAGWTGEVTFELSPTFWTVSRSSQECKGQKTRDVDKL